MNVDPARVRGRALLEEAAETLQPQARAGLVDGDPGPAIGAIIFELVVAAVAFARGDRNRCKKRQQRAEIALATLRVQFASNERLPRK